MREILFRAKREATNEWVYGYFVNEYDDFRIYVQPQIITRSGREYVNENTLGQFTGLIDSEGRKIFEGDVIQDGNCDYNKYVVEYSTERGGFLPFAHGDGCGCCETATLYDSTCHTVIGNVYDNPELIGGEEQ